jgi:hypothetical protein
MPAPEQMFTHGLDVKKGWFDMASLDYAAKLSPDIDFVVKRGRVVYVDSNGYFVPGMHQTNVAIFLLNGSEDADVSNPGWGQGQGSGGSNATQTAANFMHIAIAPTGKMSGLVATGGYEISSTEFKHNLTYAPGDLLTANTCASPNAWDGQLTNENVEQFVTPVCGVVSSGVSTNHNGVSALSFWCVWLPGSTSWTPGG